MGTKIIKALGVRKLPRKGMTKTTTPDISASVGRCTSGSRLASPLTTKPFSRSPDNIRCVNVPTEDPSNLFPVYAITSLILGSICFGGIKIIISPDLIAGATYEREVAAKIHDVLGVKLKRNLQQYQEKGLGDLILGKFIIECKRRRKIAVYEFIEQAEAACKPGEVPVVIMRADGKESLALMYLDELLPLLGNELPQQSQVDASPPEAS